MDFIANREPQIHAMLRTLGITSVDALFEAIPDVLKIPRPLKDDGMSEFEGMRWMEKLAAKNTFSQFENYLGAGAYEHHIPAIVGAICSKSEFLTSYTPYQAEASQGMLQIIFEFQSSMCALTGFEVANASVYDGASACAEALLMALRLQKGRDRVLIAESLNPHYRRVVNQYLSPQPCKIDSIPFDQEGNLRLDVLETKMDENGAALLIQSPNFFGNFENVLQAAKIVKDKGGLIILCANPLVYGYALSAKDQGADIAVGDCQPFGLSLSFGGPYVGYMACDQILMRQLPGRLVGETKDGNGKRGFVLTLQAREQHIRREKATSNICTNQALAALANLVTMIWYGPEGLKELARTNFQRASYLKKQLSGLQHLKVWNKGTTFNEFVIECQVPLPHLLKTFRKASIEPGVPMKVYFPHLSQCLLVAVTETKSLEQLNRYIEIASIL